MGLGSRFGGACAVVCLVAAATSGSGCGPKKTSHGDGDANAGAPNGDAGTGATSGSGTTGGDSGGTSQSPQPITDLDQFFEAEGRRFCERALRCFEGNDDFMSARFVLMTQARCERLVERVNATGASQRDLRAQSAAGHLQLVPQQAQRCLEALAACNGPDGFSEGPCRDAVEGDAQPGEACQRSEDCAGDAYCRVETDCPGVCTPRKQEGEPCSRADECAYSSGVVSCYHGASNGDEGTCHTLAASPPVGEGKACTRRISDATQLVTCSDGLWCDTAPGGDPSADVMGVCGPPLAEGHPCRDSDDVCLTGFCNTDTLRCEKLQIAAHEGDACNQELLQICDPLAGLVCGQDLTCHGSGDGSEGSGCYASDYQLGCQPGLYCDRSAASSSDELGTCRALLPDGKACTDSRSCASGNCGADKTCGGRACRY